MSTHVPAVSPGTESKPRLSFTQVRGPSKNAYKWQWMRNDSSEFSGNQIVTYIEHKTKDLAWIFDERRTHIDKDTGIKYFEINKAEDGRLFGSKTEMRAALLSNWGIEI